MSKTQTPKPALMLALVVALAGVGAGVFLTLAPQSEPGDIDVRASPPPPRVESSAHASPPSSVASPADPTRPTEPGTRGDDPSADKPKPNRLARDLERERIWSALGRKHKLEPAAPGSAAPSEDAAARLPKLDDNYVREAIKDQLVPVAVDCYNTVLQRDATLGGTLVFEFTIIGDEEIGGVVEDVSLADDSTLDDEFLRECLRESLLAVSFDPPPGGGRVEVRYPLHFEPESRLRLKARFVGVAARDR